jgi:acetate kinase
VIKAIDSPKTNANRIVNRGETDNVAPHASTSKTCRVLTLNSGSSSLRYSVYDMQGDTARPVLKGKLDRIGTYQSHFEAVNAAGTKLAGHLVSVSDHDSALALLLDRLPSFGVGSIEAVGHRIVQGGEHHTGPEILTPALVKELRDLCPLDPPHLSAALNAIQAAQRLGDDVPQVACFDTAFHRTLPAVAQRLPLPRELTENTGLLRYGFHGLSYEYIMGELDRVAGSKVAHGKVIIAHLGNGASMAAVEGGKCVDTTMGFTPAGGLMMGSRAGDLDSGVIDYLLREKKVSVQELSDLIYRRSGLKSVSGVSSDMRDLLDNGKGHAREAVDLFCYLARKTLGSMISVLNGVQTIVFTGGIGENAAAPRAAICAGLAHLGLEIDSRRNGQNRDVISTSASRICVRAMKTNEELVIARHTARLAFA